MVVVRGLGQKPMMLLTTLAKTTTRTDLWQVVSAYITRWRVEETLRIHELPDFHFYAIADGIKMLLSRCERWSGWGEAIFRLKKTGDVQLFINYLLAIQNRPH